MTNKQLFVLVLVGLIVIGVITALLIAEGRADDVVKCAEAMGAAVFILVLLFGPGWLMSR